MTKAREEEIEKRRKNSQKKSSAGAGSSKDTLKDKIWKEGENEEAERSKGQAKETRAIADLDALIP